MNINKFIEERCTWLALLISFLIIKFQAPVICLEKLAKCAGDLISFYSILTGFTFTSISILFTCRNKPFVKIANSYNGFNRLILFHKSAILWGLITCLVWLIYEIFFQSNCIAMVALALSIASGIAFVRLFKLFFKFMQLDC